MKPTEKKKHILKGGPRPHETTLQKKILALTKQQNMNNKN